MVYPDRKRLMALIITISSIGVLNFTLIAPTLPDLADALGVSRGTIGLVQSVAAIPGVFLAVFIGYIADINGRRFVAVSSLLLFGVAGLAGFFMNSFWALLSVRAIQGVGTSAILSLSVMVIGDVFLEVRQRRWAFAINGAAVGVTGILSPILGGYLAAGGVFRPFLVFGVALPVAVWARQLPGPVAGDPPAPPFQHIRKMFGELRDSDGLSDFLGLLPFSIIIVMVFAGIGFTATPLFLEQVFHVESTQRGLLQATLAIGTISGSLSSARLARRSEPTRVLTAALAMVALSFAVISIASNLALVAAGLLLLGFGTGSIFPLVTNFVSSSVTGAYRGVAVGVWLTSIRFGQSVGPIVGTALLTGIGERQTFAIAAVATAVVALLWLPLRRAARAALPNVASARGNETDPGRSDA